MAKVILGDRLQALWGRVGNLVFRRSRTGTAYVSTTPDMSHVKWSAAQQTQRQRFKQAVAYAQAAMADERVRAHYEQQAAAQGKRRFDLAVSDYFKGRNLIEELAITSVPPQNL